MEGIEHANSIVTMASVHKEGIEHANLFVAKASAHMEGIELADFGHFYQKRHLVEGQGRS